jgi:spermidine/putrescine transport system permease protein
VAVRSITRAGAAPLRTLPLRVGPAIASVPNLVWCALFFVVPFGLMAVYSVSTQDALTAKISYTWTADNYDRIRDSIITDAFLRSAAISAAATAGCLVLAYPVAFFMAHRAGRLKPLFLVLVIVPFWTSFVIRTYAWLGLLAPKGYVNDLLVGIGIVDRPLSLAFNTPAIVIGIV